MSRNVVKSVRRIGPAPSPALPPMDRWQADRKRWQDAMRARLVTKYKRAAMSSVIGFAVAMLMFVGFAMRLWDMRGLTWQASNPMDLMVVVATLMVPVTFMALAILVNHEACDRLANMDR